MNKQELKQWLERKLEQKREHLKQLQENNLDILENDFNYEGLNKEQAINYIECMIGEYEYQLQEMKGKK